MSTKQSRTAHCVDPYPQRIHQRRVEALERAAGMPIPKNVIPVFHTLKSLRCFNPVRFTLQADEANSPAKTSCVVRELQKMAILVVLVDSHTEQLLRWTVIPGTAVTLENITNEKTDRSGRWQLKSVSGCDLMSSFKLFDGDPCTLIPEQTFRETMEELNENQ